MKLNPKKPQSNRQAFALKELCFTVVGIVVIGVLILPLLARAKDKSPRINCCNDLKQVALAFRIWSGDNGDRYPMAALTNQNGGPLYANTETMFRYFQVMSNELVIPKVIFCPDDGERNPATNFGPGFSSKNISYFVNLNADEANPNMFLIGDRTLSGGRLMTNGTMVLSSNQNVFWLPKKMHDRNGNIARTDGSVAQLSNSRLADALAHTGEIETYLLFP